MPKLVIAEKPSVAQSLARVIGADHRKDGYLEGNGYIVSWCIGHLVELAPPEHYHENYAKWRHEDLPILPQFTDQGWKYLVSESTGKQFGVLKKLMNRSDVDVIILATDAGREGELIGRLVYHQCNCRKPMERLWISSMEDEAIRDGFHHIKPSSEYDALYEAALCRERADWIVGINATRLFSCLYRQTLQVGRVMTPTLAMVVLRDAEIAAFQSEPFYTVLIGSDSFTGVSERMKNKDDALALLAHCKDAGMIRVLDVEYKEKSEKAPALYDLTSLQRDANRTLGYTAQQTLDYAQSLYEKKLITYPRTDSRYLTEDMAPALPDWIREVAHIFALQGRDCSDAITKCQKNIYQVINDKKVSDHHAIIPTRSCKNTVLTSLPAGERQILTLIAARFATAAADPYCYKETIATLDCVGHAFSVKGKTVLREGWKYVEGLFIHKKEEKNEERTLPGFMKGMEFRLVDAELKEGKTTPPKKFTEDTLLSAMESAGAVDQESLKGIASGTFNSSTFNPSGDNSLGQVEHKGLGTPATRAGIIEKLVRTGLIKRQGDKKTRYLTSTDKGNALITVMPEQIQSPSMTADWEMKLHRMEHGSYDPEEFMGEITDMITELEASIHAIFENPESNLRRWLDVCGAFHNYSLNNTLLIAAQLPEGASGPIAGMITWNKLGRKVIKGSKAIHILAPAPYRRKVEVECRDPVTGNVMFHPDGSVMKEIKEVIQPAFKVVNCFYYGQTEGKPLPRLEINELTGNVKDYDSFFEAIRRCSPVPIGFEKIEGGAKGYFSPGENRIAINEGMSQLQTVKTGLHELVHVFLHGENPLFAEPVDGKTPVKSRNQKETEAEAACYCIANFFGIDTSDYSTLYVGSWASDKELPELKASLETIRKTADQLITKITDHLKDIHRERGVIQENALPEANAAEPEKPSVLSDLNEKKQKAKTELSKDSLLKSDKRKTEKSKQEEAL